MGGFDPVTDHARCRAALRVTVAMADAKSQRQGSGGAGELPPGPPDPVVGLSLSSPASTLLGKDITWRLGV